MKTPELLQQERVKRQTKKAKARITAKKAAYTRATKVTVEGTAAALTFTLPGVAALAGARKMTPAEAKPLTKSVVDWFNLGVDTYNRGLRLRYVVYLNLRKKAPHAGTQDCRDYADTVEEGRRLRHP